MITREAGPAADGAADHDSARRWITLAIVVMAAFIVALDNSVLNVAIPTILRDLDTDLLSLQWVLTGYSLTFATFLVIGGRLADIFGARRMFIIGAALFGAGSFLASIANTVPVLVLGEALIEGLGASLMLPATISIISNTFQGPVRATAFAAWASSFGCAVAFGPIIGGYLTTYYSWRWSFRINVIVAPIAIIGALLFMAPSPRSERRQRIDVPGAFLVASGMFLFVFGLSEGGAYGWFVPLRDFTVGPWTLWSNDAPISLVPIAFVLAVALLTTFVFVELAKERADRDPLFEFSQLRHLGFRYGLLTSMILSMGQLGLIFVMAVFLQDGRHLSAVDNGLWLLPIGVMIVFGSQIGGRLVRYVGPTVVARIGLTLEVIGLTLVAFVISPDVSFTSLLPGFVLFGSGIGFAVAQLTNVVLSDVPAERSGAASGANSTVRQIGSALGIAVVGTLLTTLTIRHAVDAVNSADDVAADVKARIISGVRTGGVSFDASTVGSGNVAKVRHALDAAVTAGARPALFFAAGVVAIGTMVSFLIPSTPPLRVEEIVELEALDADPAPI
jgi:EmrB/QacA subfamily drug resistance transporter